MIQRHRDTLPFAELALVSVPFQNVPPRKDNAALPYMNEPIELHHTWQGQGNGW